MPKMKTKSAAKKRFRVRPGGTVKRGQAGRRHCAGGSVIGFCGVLADSAGALQMRRAGFICRL